jgi:hypothetical protein
MGADFPNIFLETGSDPPPWVRDARNLPCLPWCTRSEHGQPEQPACSITSFGPNEFFGIDYSDGTQFLVDRAGEHLWGTWSPPLILEDFADYLRGPVMGLVLRLRNVTALHASVVNLSGYALVLCGESAAGKSTTAAALALRGIPVLSEDIAAIDIESERFQVHPGHPRICLWCDSVINLFGTAEALSQVSPVWEKCYLPLDGKLAKFESHRRPLGAIYLLAPRTTAGGGPRIETVSAREALLNLIQHTYMNRFLDRTQRANEFAVLSDVVAQVPVRRIVPHVDPVYIAALCDLIVEDAQTLSDGQPSGNLVSTR